MSPYVNANGRRNDIRILDNNSKARKFSVELCVRLSRIESRGRENMLKAAAGFRAAAKMKLTADPQKPDLSPRLNG